MRRLLLASGVLLAAAGLWAWAVVGGGVGRQHGAGRIEPVAVSADAIRGRVERRTRAARQVGAPSEKQILFGDLHAHTTFSSDAFLWSLPLLQGDGAHPPADACHFARFCSALDFWSINDHAESLTPERWQETVASIRACNAAAGDPEAPDLVAFLGWEWTQVGPTPDRHFGHKNVVLRDDDPAGAPPRPIAAGGENLQAIRDAPLGPLGLAMSVLDFANRQAYYDLARFQKETRAAPLCGREPAPDERCVEIAENPTELFAGLDRWGGEALVIPHGTTWGATTPPGASWAKELASGAPPASRQALIEVYSGHGNGEEYRDWGGSVGDECPPPRDDYLPVCWQAGEIVRARCRDAGQAEAECDARAAEGRALALAAGRNAVLTLPDASAAEWGDAEQCRDCFLPPFAHRPGKSVQAALAGKGADGAAFRFGLIASSDNHSARPGSGYKEFGALGMTDARGLAPGRLRDLLASGGAGPTARAVAVEPHAPGVGLANSERQASFWTTGGLVAVHAAGRDRQAIWEALERREVYGTSGPRILLWFEGRDGAEGEPLPMGSAATFEDVPHFRVRAVGSAEPLPGCPDESVTALGPSEIERLCLGECHHPSDVRRRITRVEVVRIRRQASPAEPLGSLIEDPWLVLPCAEGDAGCDVEFTDPAFGAQAGEWSYYVRAIEVASDAVGGAGPGCAVTEGDCLGPVEERAWSSPLFLRTGPGEG